MPLVEGRASYEVQKLCRSRTGKCRLLYSILTCARVQHILAAYASNASATNPRADLRRSGYQRHSVK